MKKKYRMIGSCPLIVEGYGRVEPSDPPTEFICVMVDWQEDFFVKIGALQILADVPDETPETKPLQPSTPAWPGERVLDTYEKK